MIIDTKLNIADSFLPSGSFHRKLKSSNGLFAKHLEIRMGNSAEKTDDRENKRTNMFANDIDKIKEKGLVNYFNELEAKKREELRAEMLKGMGLTEEDLGEMSPEQRALIEKIVDGEIQKRIAASSLINNNETDADQTVPEHIMHKIRAGFAFLPMMEENEKLTWLRHKRKNEGSFFLFSVTGFHYRMVGRYTKKFTGSEKGLFYL